MTTSKKEYYITEAKFKGEVYNYRSLKGKTFTPERYVKIEKLTERAETFFEDYLDGVLVIRPLEQRAFAQYIETFGSRKTEVLLDKLQQSADFDVRAYLEEKKRRWWQKIFIKKNSKISYLNARQLLQRIALYEKINRKLSGGWYHKENLYQKQIGLEKEALSLAAKIVNKEMPVNVDDMAILKKYFITFSDAMYNETVFDDVLEKLQNGDVNIVKEKPKKLKIAHLGKKILDSFKFGSTEHQSIKLKNSGRYLRRAVKVAGAVALFALTLLSIKSSEVPQNTKINHKEKSAKAPRQKVQNDKKLTTLQLKATDFNSKKEYTAEQKIWRNFYNTKNEMIANILNEDAAVLTETVKAKMAEGVLKLPDNVMAEQVVYTHLLYRAYNLASPIEEVLVAKQKLSAKQRQTVMQAIKTAGQNGLGIKKIAAAHEAKYGRKLGHNSAYDRASNKQKQKYLTNLQQVRALHALGK